ncbi:MAG TPA: protoporphyrinogen oxidase [Acidimicrobiales bacterium]|nr:protoporphyrinogen oxidase [Acidimicrobiales bacterium]
MAGDGVGVAVLGGGITGLATAWFLRQAAPDLPVTIYEAGDRLGGKIRTSELAGRPVEEGPDTFLARVPWAVELCRRIDLGDDLVEPATSRAYVWTRGALRPLPPGTVLGVPGRLGPLVRSGIVSPAGLARAGLDLVLPRRSHGDDPSVADVVAGRFGREVAQRLVEPLVGGIHAGRADRLSLTAVAPQIAGVARSSRSLLVGLRRMAPRPGGPVFLGVRGGLGRLVDRLADRLDGVDVRLRSPVVSLDDVAAAAVVCTLPAPAAARLAPAEAAAELGAIRHASVVTVTLAYPATALARPLDGSGFLVPRIDGRLMTACSWTSSKWPGSSPDGVVFLRPSAGRIGDDRAVRLDDATLVDRLHGELVEAMGLRARPAEWLVSRWPEAFPQYDVGHQARVARIEAALPPGLVLAGAPYRGVGIAACIRDAELAAAKAVAAVGLAA